MPGRRQSLLTEGGGDCGLLLEPPNVGPVLELHLTPVDDVGVVKDRLNLGVPSSKQRRITDGSSVTATNRHPIKLTVIRVSWHCARYQPALRLSVSSYCTKMQLDVVSSA